MSKGQAASLWVRLAEDVERAIGRRLGYWRVLGVTDTGRLRVGSFDPNEPGEREVRKLRGVPVVEGDGVVTLRLPGLFEVALGAVLLADQTDNGGGGEVPEHEHELPEHDHPSRVRYEQATATAAIVASTTDTVNYQEAIADTIALPAGSWTIKVRAQGNFSHSANGSMSRAIEIDGADVGVGTVTLTSTRETYPVATERTGISGGRTITCKFKYRSNSAGTTACRAPSLEITAEKE
jgi:hypothetical protein